MPVDERLALLKPVDFLLAPLPVVNLAGDDWRRFSQGMSIRDVVGRPGSVRAYAPDGCFLGLAALDDEGVLKPKRLISHAS